MAVTLISNIERQNEDSKFFLVNSNDIDVSEGLEIDSNFGTGNGSDGTSLTKFIKDIKDGALAAGKVNSQLKVGSKAYDGSQEVIIEASDLGLANALHFIGIKDDIPTGTNYTNGDVILVNGKEYVYNEGTWVELGDENSFALKTISVTGTNGLTGTGTLDGNVTLSHDNTSDQASISAANRTYISGITLDDYGHVTALTTAQEVMSNAGTILIDLASNNTATYTDGGDILPGVTGILSAANGGTGNDTGRVQIGQKEGETLGAQATSEGNDTIASGTNSHAEGFKTQATGFNGHSEGNRTIASGGNSHAQGLTTHAKGAQSFSAGDSTLALGRASTAIGSSVIAIGDNSMAIGLGNKSNIVLSGDANAVTYTTYARKNMVKTILSNKQVQSNGQIVSISMPSQPSTQITTSATPPYGSQYGTTQLYDSAIIELAPGYKYYLHFNSSFTYLFSNYDVSNSTLSGKLTIPANKVIDRTNTTTSIYLAGIISSKTQYYRASTIPMIDGSTNTTRYQHSYHLTTGASSRYTLEATRDEISLISLPSNAYILGEFGYAHITNQDGTTITTDKTLSSTSVDTIEFTLLNADVGALGENSFVSGYKTTATAINSHAEGNSTTASGRVSHAQGYLTQASGNYSHAESKETVASGEASHAEGDKTLASGDGAHAEGSNTTASGEASHAEGYNSVVSGDASHAEGNYTQVSGDASHAEGNYTQAINSGAHAEGSETIAHGLGSHAEGSRTFAYGLGSHAEGGTVGSTYLTGEASATTYTLSQANNNIRPGCMVKYNNVYAQITAYDSTIPSITVDKTLSDTELSNTEVIMYLTVSLGDAAHVEGAKTIASGSCSHAEGNRTTASGDDSHAEGFQTDALSIGAHSEGGGTVASGDYSHAEGGASTASGAWSHSEGYNTSATGEISHAAGCGTIAAGSIQTAIGRYNIEDTTSAFIIGNGDDAENRSNAMTVDWDGNITATGSLTATSFTGPLQGNAATATKATQDGNGNTITDTYLPLSGGTLTGSLSITANEKYLSMVPLNASYAHFNTDADSGFWFNKQVNVQGDIYGGSDYHEYCIRVKNGGAHDCNALYDAGLALIQGGTNYPSGSSYGTLFVMPYRKSVGNTKPDYGAQIFIPCGDDASHPNSMFFRTSTSDSWNSWQRLWKVGDAVTGAVWNDYAECRESDCNESGYVLSENGDDTLSKSNERLAPFAGVSSDTWGFSQGETERAKTHIAVAGRVLVYPYQDRNNYKPGDCVCAAPDGTVDIMTREEIINWPDRIVGTVSCVPQYEEWGGGQGADRPAVKVNGRIWIKVK